MTSTTFNFSFMKLAVINKHVFHMPIWAQFKYLIENPFSSFQSSYLILTMKAFLSSTRKAFIFYFIANLIRYVIFFLFFRLAVNYFPRKDKRNLIKGYARYKFCVDIQFVVPSLNSLHSCTGTNFLELVENYIY